MNTHIPHAPFAPWQLKECNRSLSDVIMVNTHTWLSAKASTVLRFQALLPPYVILLYLVSHRQYLPTVPYCPWNMEVLCPCSPTGRFIVSRNTSRSRSLSLSLPPRILTLPGVTTSTRHTQCTRHTNRRVQLACWSKCRLLLTVVVTTRNLHPRDSARGRLAHDLPSPWSAPHCRGRPTESRAPSSWRRRVSGHRVDRQLGGSTTRPRALCRKLFSTLIIALLSPLSLIYLL